MFDRSNRLAHLAWRAGAKRLLSLLKCLPVDQRADAVDILLSKPSVSRHAAWQDTVPPSREVHWVLNNQPLRSCQIEITLAQRRYAGRIENGAFADRAGFIGSPRTKVQMSSPKLGVA